MSRNHARSRRAPAAMPQRATPADVATAPQAMADRWQRTLDITRSVLGASLGSQQAWLRGLGDWREAQVGSLRKACERIEQLADQVEHAPDWPALWAVQAHLAGSQWTQAMQDSTDLIERAMQIESRWVECSRADATRLSQRWLAGPDGVGDVNAPDATASIAPLVLFSQAQEAMNEMSRVWTQVLYNTRLPD
jgi:Phasin protein